jgi:aminoglycoside 2'-N-acetyltransferase I
LRRLLDDAFAGAFSDDDWEHALGGVHACAYAGEELIGHASLVPRRLWLDGRELRGGYVEAVAVRADWRRRGVGGGLMAPLEEIVRREYDLGALSATDAGELLYVSRGWRRWEGPLRPEHDSVHVFGDVAVTGELRCDWRSGDLW